jgi:hypothetical protein
MKKFTIITFLLSAFSIGLWVFYSAKSPVISMNNASQVRWVPQADNPQWSQTTAFPDGTKVTNAIIIGFREDGVMCWKVGGPLK